MGVDKGKSTIAGVAEDANSDSGGGPGTGSTKCKKKRSQSMTGPSWGVGGGIHIDENDVHPSYNIHRFSNHDLNQIVLCSISEMSNCFDSLRVNYSELNMKFDLLQYSLNKSESELQATKSDLVRERDLVSNAKAREG